MKYHNSFNMENCTYDSNFLLLEIKIYIIVSFFVCLFFSNQLDIKQSTHHSVVITQCQLANTKKTRK